MDENEWKNGCKMDAKWMQNGKKWIKNGWLMDENGWNWMKMDENINYWQNLQAVFKLYFIGFQHWD